MRGVGLIVAYDRSDAAGAAHALLRGLSGAALLHFPILVKVGLEAMTAEGLGGKTVADMICELSHSCGLGVMWDQKICDIGNTCKKAAENIARKRGVSMLTVMAAASTRALRCVAQACGDAGILPLAVTVLTDIDERECVHVFGKQPAIVVLDFARRAQDCGIRGLVCSGQELAFLRSNGIGDDMVFVVPGIRLAEANLKEDDQKRTMTPAEARRQGADYIVVGRPIMTAKDPAKQAQRFLGELQSALV